MKINEIFLSIQGEGQRTGIPSIFIRTVGCNCRCCFAGGSKCDTPYTSFNPEKPIITTVDETVRKVRDILEKHPHVSDIVITGGEPMLQQAAMVTFLWDLRKAVKRELFVTVETNGSVELDHSFNWEEYVNLWSISPKLKSSCCHPDKESADAKLHERNRYSSRAAFDYLVSQVPIQYKFVYSGPQSEEEILNFLGRVNSDLYYMWEDAALSTFELNFAYRELGKVPVLIMPEGTVPEEISKSADGMVDVCIKHGWRFCDRLHIRLWGNKRAV